jgi:hypothetical protein
VTNGAWLPILQQHGPALIQQCENAKKLASRLATEWLQKYMLADREDREKRAARIVRYFVDHHEHQSHALGIDRDAARKHGVVGAIWSATSGSRMPFSASTTRRW